MFFIHLGTVITVNGVSFVAYGSRKRMLTESVIESTRSIVLNVRLNLTRLLPFLVRMGL